MELESIFRYSPIHWAVTAPISDGRMFLIGYNILDGTVIGGISMLGTLDIKFPWLTALRAVKSIVVAMCSP